MGVNVFMSLMLLILIADNINCEAGKKLLKYTVEDIKQLVSDPRFRSSDEKSIMPSTSTKKEIEYEPIYSKHSKNEIKNYRIESAHKIWNEFVSCTQKDFVVSDYWGNVGEIFEKNCKNITKYTECKHNYERDILKLGFSLDEKEMEISIRESIIQYVCLFDSETLSSYFGERGTQCLWSKEKAIRQCVDDMLAQRDSYSGLFGGRDITNYLVMLQTQDCVLSKASECHYSPYILTLVNRWYNYFADTKWKYSEKSLNIYP